jgi:hypothetical protein
MLHKIKIEISQRMHKFEILSSDKNNIATLQLDDKFPD